MLLILGIMVNMVDKEKFKILTNDGYYSVIDTETGRQLDLNNKYHVKQLITLLNDWCLIIQDKWLR